MKHKSFTAAAVCLFIAVFPTILISADGKLTGKIGSIDTGKKEIIINIESGRNVKMGEKLYVRIDDKVVIMEATFPMLTTAKCKLVKGSTEYFKQLEKGIRVYKYDKSAVEDKDSDKEKNEQTAGKPGEIRKFGNTEMVYIEGGTFTMGSPESEEYRSSDEKQHKVTLSPFWMGKYEVTQKQYSEVMGTNPSYFVGTGQDLSKLPVERVSWYDAIEFCNKLS